MYALFRHMNVFAFDRDRTFYPGQFSTHPLPIPANVDVVKVCKVREGLPIYSVETVEHPAARCGHTKVNMPDAPWKLP